MGTTASPKPGWKADPGRRRSMRVLLSVPIVVSGKTANNEDFKEETRTLVVNAHGALIALAAQVVAQQTLPSPIKPLSNRSIAAWCISEARKAVKRRSAWNS